MSLSDEPVEFVLNCFERNIDMVTRPGFLKSAVDQHRLAFQTRTLLVNNVVDHDRAAALAQATVDRGEVDRFFFVENLLSEGLAATGLRVKDFGRYLHWSDCCVVALVLPGPDLLCYVDVDLTLEQPVDWISPALAVMQTDPRVAVGKPVWMMPDGGSALSSAMAEADEEESGRILGYGFTDQVFLVRRSQFTRRLLPRWVPLWVHCPVTCRFPASHGGMVFEQIADGFMRRNRLLRVTITGATFRHLPMSSYPPGSLRERLRSKRNALILDALTGLRRRWPTAVTNPCLRMTGLLDPTFMSLSPAEGPEIG